MRGGCLQDLADKAKEALQAQHEELRQLHGMLEAREAMLHKLAGEHVSTAPQGAARTTASSSLSPEALPA